MEKRQNVQPSGYLQSLLNSSPVAIIATDAEGNITFVNKEACRLLEREMRELVGESIVIGYESLETARDVNRNIYRSGGVIQDYESRIRTKTGKIITVRVSAAHLKDSSGNYIGAVGFFERHRPWLAEEKRLKARAEELEAKFKELKDAGTPVLEIFPGLIIAVITGHLDAERFSVISTNILDRISSAKARVVLIDLTSAEVTGDAVAADLAKTIRTAQLLGTRSVLAGLQLAVARGMESQLSDLSSISSYSSRDEALQAALSYIGFQIERKGPAPGRGSNE